MHKLYYLFLLFVSLTTIVTPTFAKAQLMMPTFSAAEVEARVREVFADATAMIAVAECESKFKQSDSNGIPLRSGPYIGVFQIDENVHISKALSLGMDIFTLEGNLAYARRLYDQQGTTPWKGCLKGAAPPASTVVAPVAVGSQTLTINLRMGMSHAQVKTLQQLLNQTGFTVSATGSGSPGHETTLFGSLTRAAVQKFQCSKQIACSGTESTTGYGHVGPRTRTAIMQAAQN